MRKRRRSSSRPRAKARAEIDARYAALLIPPFNAGSQWAVPASQDVVEGIGTAFADPNVYPVTDRGVTYAMGYFSAKRLGTGQYYLMSINDRAGHPLDGRKTYRLTIPPHAPVQQYWSATAYDRKTHALIQEMSRSSRASNSPDLKTNADGSVAIYFGPTAPSPEGGPGQGFRRSRRTGVFCNAAVRVQGRGLRVPQQTPRRPPSGRRSPAHPRLA